MRILLMVYVRSFDEVWLILEFSSAAQHRVPVASVPHLCLGAAK